MCTSYPAALFGNSWKQMSPSAALLLPFFSKHAVVTRTLRVPFLNGGVVRANAQVFCLFCLAQSGFFHLQDPP